MPDDIAGRPRRPDGADTKTRLIEAAEKLFGLHGLDGVSSRQITWQAGQRNESAIQYHFGDRRGLMQAIVNRRSGLMDRLRHARLDELIATGRAADVRALWDCVTYPLAFLGREEEGRSHYCRFIDQVLRTRSLEGLEVVWHREDHSVHRCLTLMRRARPDLPYDLFMTRYSATIAMVHSGMAEIEVAIEQAAAENRPYDPMPETENLVDMAAAAFDAPVSTETMTALQTTEGGASHPLRQWPPEWLRPKEDPSPDGR